VKSTGIRSSRRAAFKVLLEFRFLSFAEVPDFEYYWTPTLHLSQEDIRDDEAEIRGLDPDLCVEGRPPGACNPEPGPRR